MEKDPGGVVNQNARPRRGAGVMTCTTSPGQVL